MFGETRKFISVHCLTHMLPRIISYVEKPSLDVPNVKLFEGEPYYITEELVNEHDASKISE